jgi:hypothetical protein
MAASPAFSVRSAVRVLRCALVLSILSCAEPTAISPRPAPTAVVAEEQGNSFSINAADRTVYLRVVHVRAEGGEPIHSFLGRMMDSADVDGAQRLVVDLRSIEGSDARLLVPLIKGIVRRDRFLRAGGLYVVVGPNSFSPAQRAATLLRQYAHPILVAQPPPAGQ